MRALQAEMRHPSRRDSSAHLNGMNQHHEINLGIKTLHVRTITAEFGLNAGGAQIAIFWRLLGKFDSLFLILLNIHVETPYALYFSYKIPILVPCSVIRI